MEENEILRNYTILAPAPLAPQIANVWLQSPANRLFLAGTAPTTALAALIFTLEQNAPLSSEEWETENRNRTRSDLTALGLIRTVSGFIEATIPNDAAPEASLRHAAAKAPMLQFTRVALQANPNLNPVELGHELGEEFERNYQSDHTKDKVGRALRRWAFWLEPHLIPPNAKKNLGRMRVAATLDAPKVGAPSLASSPKILAQA